MADIELSKIGAALRSAGRGEFESLWEQFGSPYWYDRSELSQQLGKIANDLNDQDELDLSALLVSLPAGEDAARRKACEIFFWAILPALNMAPSDLVKLIGCLVESGKLPPDDNWYNDSLYKWCRQDIARSTEILRDALSDTSQPSHGILSVLIAGSEIEPWKFTEASIAAINDPRTNVRRASLRALGLLKAVPAEMLNQVLKALEQVIRSGADPDAAAEALNSLLLLFARYRQIASSTISAYLVIAREHIPEETLRRIGGNALFRQAGELPDEVTDALYLWLRDMKSNEGDTLQVVDHAFYRTAKSDRFLAAIELLGTLLKANPDLSVRKFTGFLTAIWEAPDRLNRLVFEWLGTGDEILCRAVRKIVTHHADDVFRMSFDMTEAGATPAMRELICRRAMLNLLHQPMACASILLSAMRGADSATRRRIAQWLLDPLLLNFSGDLLDYLREQQKSDPDDTGIELSGVLASFDTYQNNLLALGRVREFEPSDNHRFMAMEQRNAEMDEAEERSEYKSPFAEIFTRSTVLWGGKPIIHRHTGRDKKPAREVMTMHTHAFSYEFPRISALNPVGQNYQIYKFGPAGDDE